MNKTLALFALFALVATTYAGVIAPILGKAVIAPGLIHGGIIAPIGLHHGYGFGLHHGYGIGLHGLHGIGFGHHGLLLR